ncbi:hypothetical protein M0802_015855 [Mischocyttarus mexicanus]|nr:hypothetical protein M0802_015855 [Mischocyttarus mexicanus]
MRKSRKVEKHKHRLCGSSGSYSRRRRRRSGGKLQDGFWGRRGLEGRGIEIRVDRRRHRFVIVVLVVVVVVVVYSQWLYPANS